jgi:hypothetical protein
VIYLYAIADRRDDLPAVTGDGLADAPLRTLDFAGLTGVYTSGRGLEPAADALWRHEHVVEGLMAERAVLPMRFGSTLEDRAALRALMRDRADEFTAALDFVRGRVEMGIRARLERVAGFRGVAAGADATATPPGSGREYVEEKLARRRAARAVTAELDERLGPFAVARTFKTAGDDVAGAYLVERSAADDFRQRAREAGGERPEVELTCTGPWPPYNFTEAR